MNTVIVADRFLKDTKLKALDKNERYIISKEKENKNKPQFLMIGKGIKMKKENISVDLLKEVSNMSSNEKFAFFKLRDAMSYKDETLSDISVTQSSFTAYEKKMFKAGVSSLIDKKLIARIKRGTYQINPYAIMPTNFDDARELWLSKVKYDFQDTKEYT